MTVEVDARGVEVLGVDGLRVRFGDTVALDGIDLKVPTGSVTAVVGGDGAGKSTLLRVLAGRIRPESGAVRTLDKRRIGYQPATSGVWGNLTVEQNLDFVGRSFGMSTAELRGRAEELLAPAGLDGARDRLGRELSGGMRQKLGFLLAILHRPELVLLDEPSTGVDPVSRVELWRLVATTAAGGTAVLLSTTYLDEAQRAASVTALDRGRAIASGTADQIIEAMPGAIIVDPDASETDAAGSGASGAGDDGLSWRRGRARHRWVREADPSSTAIAPDLEDALIAYTLSREEGGAAAEGAIPVTRPDSAPLEGVVAAGDGITRRFGSHVAVDHVSLEVRSGEIVGLIGANGAGKTTFLRALIGLDRIDEGRAELFGRAPDAASRERLGYVPQGLGLSRTISVDENVEFFSRVYGMPRPELPPSLRSVRRALVGAIGLGRQRQLAFVLALAHRPDLLVLDEPTSGVDPLSRARLWDTIHAEADAGRAVIVTTHYMQEAEQCTRLALMSHGRLLGAGTVDELTTGVTATEVRTESWQEAFTALSDAGLPTILSGTTVRVAGVDPERVRAALGGRTATIEAVPPTIEEVMLLLEGPPR